MKMSAKMLRSQFYIYSTTHVVGLYGNVVETTTLKSGPHKCHCTYLSGNKQVFAGKLNVVATNRLFCDLVDIRSDDRIYVVGIGWFNCLYLDNCNQHNHHIEVLLERIEEPQVLDFFSSSSSSEEYSTSSSSDSSDSSDSSSSTSETSQTSASESSSSLDYPDLFVQGTSSPTVTSEYYYRGQYDGHAWYSDPTNTYYIWWFSMGSQWMLTDQLGIYNDGGFDNDTLLGEYIAGGTWSGSVDVSVYVPLD